MFFDLEDKDVMKKIHRQACVQDYSENIQRNATFKVELQHCMELTYMNNGSRVFSAQIEVGFHPLVITNSDRLFSVRCIDNSHAVAHLASKKEDKCIVDSELMGEIVYNNFMPKIFARARVFKLVNDEKYRIECQVQMCTMDGVCKDRIFPPKCAFTKEEILNRYMAKPKVDSIEDTIMTGTINNRYERQVKVASEWITVHNNQYTNIEQLHERYYLSTVMNDKMEDTKAQPVMRHFLMGISYRNPNQTDTSKSESTEKDASSERPIHPSVAFRPNNTPIISSEILDVEVVSPSGSSLPNLAGTGATVKTSESSSASSTTESKSIPSTTSMRSHKASSNHNHLHTSDVLSNKISRPNAGVNKAEEVTADPEPSVFAAGDNDIKEKFANPRDWRLDDRTINDTDILPERQVACSNATIIAVRLLFIPGCRVGSTDYAEKMSGYLQSQRKCTWSGIEHLLVVWSFASLLVWMVMIAVCFYRQANKPAWVEFRSRMIPEQFLNTHFVEVKQENLDDYLTARGVPWLVRKLISGKMQKGQFLMKPDGDGYVYNTGNAARNLEYRFKLGETFTDTGYDGKQHKITISMEGDKLKEVHFNLERDVGGEDVFFYSIQNGNLISTCEAEGNGKKTIWKREFAKKN
ncbi:hypothetical protein ANCCEY_01530 [Ancylostoma ceylanicum]|uniref:Cuticlin N-terminal domain-containing protein n=2 Tax=Ancylostoma ceylanicum TaxID=53326 RepID=A0A0D6MA37_9BILA|nr:hypothetical protein ANCCEY_01530 [Ancylostoma ceylanicum]